MGLDVYIFRAKTKKVFDDKRWYDSDNVKEVCQYSKTGEFIKKYNSI